MIGNSTKVLVPLATMAVAVAVTVGSGATWTSSTGINSSVKAGSIITTNSHGGASLNIAGMQPGDVQSGSLAITNTGDLHAKLVLAQQPGASNPFADPANLTLQITDETATTIWSGNFAALTSQDLDTDLTPGEVHTYTFTVTLSPSTPGTEQGKSASAAFTFTSTPVNGQAPSNNNWL